MSTLAETWDRHADPLTEVVNAVTDWDAPSPCEGWTAADVLDHLMQTHREFMLRHGREVPLVAGTPAEQWNAHAAAMAALVRDGDLVSRPLETPFGDSTVGQVLLDFYGMDLIVHRWDLATSQGEDHRLTDEELAEVDAAVDGYGQAAYAPGIFKEAVPVAPGASRQEQVLGRTGRAVRRRRPQTL
ncbi:TIGR03086 family protein [Citricoccus sp. SGAir0253]|uniref:maleylpyruvate isomerase N-terminal domain-containing protein n=1 Tax=Citricoccus sp. SGAir0253 TaxID=2567881 RepID=UPI0010CD12E4|nr:maleylpyruvate isomerase N-terminal domain-containing protein [Citricoccus sp. SGAir0253]QCU79157.1 TIGR03086 family protein [Citricoccus sp. SGAir0253]